MSKKLITDEWEQLINKYYDSQRSKTTNKFCDENWASKQQFHYHKKRIRERVSMG